MHDALSFALGEARDPVLLDLVLLGVQPLQGDRELLVTVCDDGGHGLLAALAALDRARGFLRAAVAEHVHRKHAPQLSFTVVPPGGAA